MAKQVRVGIVGTSWYADLMHLPALKSHAQVQLAAICGRKRGRAEEMAKKYEIPQVFTDLTLRMTLLYSPSNMKTAVKA